MENQYFRYLAIKTFPGKEPTLSYERIQELQGCNLTPDAQDSIGDLKYILLILSRIVPDLVYDITTFERIPVTIPEILTLIEGVTIGGHRTVDVDSTNNIIRAYKYLINLIKTNPDQDLAELYRTLHTSLSVNLIDTPGQYRKCKVRIGGASDWSSVDCERIPEFVTQLFAEFESKPVTTCSIMRLFVQLVYLQPFEDCNKRAARLIANYVLVKNKLGIFSVHHSLIPKVNGMLIQAFNTGDLRELIHYLTNNCMMQFKDRDIVKDFTKIGLPRALETNNFG